MTWLTLRAAFDNMTIEFGAADFEELTQAWQQWADVRTLAVLTAGGLNPQVVSRDSPAAPVPADPWGQAAPPQAPAQSQGSTFRRMPAPPAQPPPPAESGTVTVQTPNGLQVWTLAPNGAPACKCGEASALVHGTNKNGGAYNAYRCAKGAGDNWRAKCDFNQWA